MNSVGIGLVVALGAIIGLVLVAGSASVAEYVTTAIFYGLLAGAAAEILLFVVSMRRRY